MKKFSWARKGGYECSSKGDKRFSAFNAVLRDGRTIEQHYQCDVKGYDPSGTNWRLGKGKPPVDGKVHLLWPKYLWLWKLWVGDNIPLMRELYVQACVHDYVLSDMFATTDINQAHALSTLLNHLSHGENIETII